jgi:acyl-CoA hydrolase
LRDGGLPVNPHGVLFAGQLMQQVAQIAAMQAGRQQ